MDGTTIKSGFTSSRVAVGRSVMPFAKVIGLRFSETTRTSNRGERDLPSFNCRHNPHVLVRISMGPMAPIEFSVRKSGSTIVFINIEMRCEVSHWGKDYPQGFGPLADLALFLSRDTLSRRKFDVSIQGESVHLSVPVNECWLAIAGGVWCHATYKYEPFRQNHFGERRNGKARRRSLEAFVEGIVAGGGLYQKPRRPGSLRSLPIRGGPSAGGRGTRQNVANAHEGSSRSLQRSGLLDGRSQA